MPKFLILRFSSIGDIVLTTPVIRCLKQQVPGAEIHYLTKKAFEPVLKNNPFIDALHVFSESPDECLSGLNSMTFDAIIDLPFALERRIAWAYALRPSLIPSLTVIGLDFAALLASAFLVEQVFAWPGLSRYGVQVILFKDLNAIVGAVMVIGFFFIVINLAVDLLVAMIDPRIRLGAGRR